MLSVLCDLISDDTGMMMMGLSFVIVVCCVFIQKHELGSPKSDFWNLDFGKSSPGVGGTFKNRTPRGVRLCVGPKVGNSEL